MRRLAARWHALACRGFRLTRRDEGFTLVEIVLATGIMAGALAMLAQTFVTGLTATGVGRQRQSGNSLANQAMEQVRALPLDTVHKGMYEGDFAGDPRITPGCGFYCFKPDPAAPGAGEQILGTRTTSPAPPQRPPLYPHVQTRAMGPTTFTIKTYVSYFGDASANAYRVTVLVNWTPLHAGAKGQTQSETILHYPQGCLSTATRPFSGPCQAAFSTQGQIPSGSVRVEPHPEFPDGVAGMQLDHAEFLLPKASADLRVEQITAANASVQTSGGSIQRAGTPAIETSPQTKGVAANNDPAQPGDLYASEVPDTQTPGAPLSLTGSPGNALTVSTGAGGDNGRATATPSATTSSSPSRNCPNLFGHTDKTGDAPAGPLPCAASSVQQATTGALTLTATSGATTLGPSTLASVGTQTTAPSVAITERLKTAATPSCPAPSDVDCVRVSVSRAPQTVSLGGIPTDLQTPPPGWGGHLVELSGFTDTASAAAGLGTGAPTGSMAGTVSVYDRLAGEGAGGYVPYPINADGTFGATSVEKITFCNDIENGVPICTYPALNVVDTPNQLQITINGTIHRGNPNVVQDETATDCVDNAGVTSCTRTKSSATPTPVKIDLEYHVTTHDGQQTLARLNVHLDPGTLLAGASYAEAPS